MKSFSLGKFTSTSFSSTNSFLLTLLTSSIIWFSLENLKALFKYTPAPIAAPIPPPNKAPSPVVVATSHQSTFSLFKP